MVEQSARQSIGVLHSNPIAESVLARRTSGLSLRTRRARAARAPARSPRRTRLIAGSVQAEAFFVTHGLTSV